MGAKHSRGRSRGGAGEIDDRWASCSRHEVRTVWFISPGMELSEIEAKGYDDFKIEY